MAKSLKFKHINSNIYNITELIYNNQNILRYLNYLTDEPLATKTVNRMGKIVKQPDLTLPFKESQIIRGDFNNKILSTEKCTLFFSPNDFDLSTKKVVGDSIYLVNIIVPTDFQILDGSGDFRYIKIAEELSEIIDGENVAGVGNVEIFRAKMGNLDENYCFMTLWIKVRNMTIKSGGV